VTTINLYQAKTRLSELVERAARGEEIVIAKAGRARARLVPLPDESAPRRPGIWKGRVRIGADFDAPLPASLQAAFEGAGESVAEGDGAGGDEPPAR
jgi:prevent-host-death family protein